VNRAGAARGGKGPDTAAALAAGALSPAPAEAEQSDASAPGRRRRWLWASIGLGGLVVVLIAVGALASRHFSSIVLVPDHSEWRAGVEIEALTPGRISLAHSDEADRPGIYGLEWSGGHAIVGPILSSGKETVTRRLSDVDGYLVPGTDAGFDSDVFAGSPHSALGVPSSTVEVKGELGQMPAWLVPAKAGRRGDWAIVVHGINGTPQEGLRLVPALRATGLTSLLITYRDDLGAPSSPDGLHHLGQTEWRDLEAAARYALDHGARRLVLVGYSMGGAVIAQFMENSHLAPKAAALVLDAPALDWRRILEFNATEMGLPASSALPLEWTIGARIDADWDSLDALQHPEDFQLPILLFNGTEDDVVPIEGSDEFAEELPGRVTYYRVPRAGHTQAWNVDPRLYEARLTRFLHHALAADSAKALQTG
jgi:alpha-beta hydrolase superfamily lysophospholipase